MIKERRYVLYEVSVHIETSEKKHLPRTQRS